VCLAHLGRHQETRAIRERFGDVGSDQDESSISILTDLLEVAVLGGDRDTARALVRRLAPLAPYPFAKGPGVSYARLLGGAAALLGEREQGHAYYQQALEVCGPIRFRPEIALTHLQLAELQLQEGEEGGSADRLSRRQEALGHLDFAIEELRVMKMQPYLDRALAHRALLHA
jgi:tetratricopeptide (TPR) repeat protein